MSKHHDTPAWLRAIQRDGGPIAEGRPRVLDERGAIQPKLDEIAREARKRACEATQWHHEQGDSAPFQSRAVPLREAGSARAPRAAGDPAEPAETAYEPPRTGGHLDAPERPYRVYRDGDRIAVTVSAEPLTLAEAMNLCAALLATTAPMHRATLPKERI